MAPTLPTFLPSSLTAGMTWRWDETLGDYPTTEGWSFARRFVGDGFAQTLTSTPTGGVYQFSASATETAAFPAGDYRVTAVVTQGGTKYALDTVVVTVYADPTTLAPGSQRTEAETLLLEVDAAIKAIVSGQVASYSVGGRSFSMHSLTELRTYRGSLAARVWRERNPGQSGPRLAVAFKPTS
jgi:hypothetical protein